MTVYKHSFFSRDNGLIDVTLYRNPPLCINHRILRNSTQHNYVSCKTKVSRSKIYISQVDMDVRNTNLDKAVTVANISIAIASYNGIAFLRNPFPVNLIQTRKTKQTQEGAW